MNEVVLRFGPSARRVGISSRPAEPRPGAPTVLLLNAGLIHRTGPNRLHVSLARRLSSMGFPALRFDFTGVGDSPASDDDLSVPERAMVDIRAAMDATTGASGANRFVTLGLCSGAFAAHMAAVRDERVVGCAQLDGYIYPTRGYYIRHYARRALTVDAWVRRFRLQSGGPSHGGAPPEQSAPFAAEMIPRERFESEVADLIDRDVRLLFVMTRGGLQAVNYRNQLQDCMPGVDLATHATVVHYPDAHHTFVDRSRRQALIDAISRWMDRGFPAVSPAVR